jgi:hypothetical protein
MGKPSLKKKRAGSATHKSADHAQPTTLARSGSKVLDGDETIFAEMARELREEGNKLFQRRDYDRALLTYEKSLKLLPSPTTGPAPPLPSSLPTMTDMELDFDEIEEEEERRHT